MSNPRVVIGGGRPNRLPALVCEYSIKRLCPEAEVIQTWHRPFIPDEHQATLHRDRWEDPCEWLSTRHHLGTMFSYCRHMVPEICGHEGEAIYVDADMIVFDSVERIWELPYPGEAKLLRLQSGQFSVMKMQCDALKAWTIRRILTDRIPYRDLMQGRHLPRSWIARTIPDVWNHTDRFYPGKTKLLHFTRMRT